MELAWSVRETHAEQREARMRQQKADGSALQPPPRLVASLASHEAASTTSPASHEAASTASPASHEAASTPATRERPSTAGHEALRLASH